jgi:hypothetical protein
MFLMIVLLNCCQLFRINESDIICSCYSFHDLSHQWHPNCHISLPLSPMHSKDQFYFNRLKLVLLCIILFSSCPPAVLLLLLRTLYFKFLISSPLQILIVRETRQRQNFFCGKSADLTINNQPVLLSPVFVSSTRRIVFINVAGILKSINFVACLP